MVSRSLDRIWIGGTISLISFIAFSSQIFVVWPQYGREFSVDLIKLLFPFNCLIFMVFWNYRLCVITPPGGVPQGWRPDMSSLDGMEVKRGSHAPRFCKMCEHYKPPRAHHCRQCKTCVTSDHCPWIANCVGFHNQGHFIRFLFWVDLATSYHLFLLVNRVFDLSKMAVDEPTLSDVLFLIFNFAACAPVWICVGMFSLYHLYLASDNTTTIERWEKDKVATLVRRGKIREIAYPYNIGTYKNLQAVLGPNPFLWLWPQTMKGDGLSFPVTPDAGDMSVQYLWPPSDPTRLTNPPPPDASASPFVYGVDSLNPHLRPSNSAMRADCSNPQWDSDSDSERQSSSPEPYLSDYDDARWGPGPGPGPASTQRITGRRTHVRQGSEGLEVRSVPAWDSAGWNEDVEGRLGARPWEEDGRYNVYEPEVDSGSASGDDWGNGNGNGNANDSNRHPEPRRIDLKAD
ncbi:DHHC palmitoyltransferase-domain-containing protein [Naematelia encephala]|uniref:Palmitoyltransferase n=1 Tax=Naematelia encephala TaxID=71784 RepID=A0A1Y2B5J0_9TREE|nr:DHHC palmitoyltransferase-domain-containing protein [Naematelia encephala]